MAETPFILILVPGRHAQGGVNNYYKALRNKFPSNVHYFTRGSRAWPKRRFFVLEYIRIIYDVLRFFGLLIISNYHIVQTTTAFTKMSILRDGVFVLIAKMLRKKVIVFFRGWNEEFAEVVERRHLKLFKYVFFKSDAIIELSGRNIDRLRLWGYEKKIIAETTLVDDALVEGLSEEIIITRIKEAETINLLFMSRVEAVKGIYIALDAYSLAKKHSHVSIHFYLAGDGSEMTKVRQYIANHGIADVHFCGYVQGIEKKNLLHKCHVFIFPTMHGEGMPNAILEAMACGMPVITRPMGGAIDIVKNGHNGYVTESVDPVEFADYIEHLISDKLLIEKIALTNYHDAGEKFYASRVVKRMVDIFNEMSFT